MRTHLLSIILILTFFLICSCSMHSGKAPTGGQDVTLITNADIVTMDPQNPSADALAVSEGRIVAIGTEAQVRAAVGDYAKYYDLKGQTVVPGFFETHDHMFLSSSAIEITDVTPFTTPTLAAALDKISHTQPNKDGWILAFGADQELYQEKRGPTRDLLDKLFPNTPVMVFHLSGHGGFANSAALTIAGIDETTPDPAGGYYEKDKAGKLTGYLSGQPALFTVMSYPNPTPETALLGAEERASKGVTTTSEFAIMNSFILDGLQKATSSPIFPVRVVGGLFSTAPGFEELAPRLKNYENDLLAIPFIKTWTDGSIQGGTGDLTDGYYDTTMGGDGAQGTQDFFNKQILRMYELGYWPAIHANGDGAVDTALNALEFVKESIGEDTYNASRPQIIHAQYTRPKQIDKMAELNVNPTFFITHVYYYGDLHYEKTLGPIRAERMSAMADAFRAGLHTSMHNDPPVTPVDPLLNIWIAVKRTSNTGRILGAGQAITPEQALKAYTIEAAYQFGMEKDAGSLEVGKFADFVVLDRNPLTVDPDEIRNIKIYATICGGRVTYVDIPDHDHVDYPGSSTAK